MNLRYLVISEIKETLKNSWDCIKKTEKTTWKGSHWPKINHFEHQNSNYSNALKHTKQKRKTWVYNGALRATKCVSHLSIDVKYQLVFLKINKGEESNIYLASLVRIYKITEKLLSEISFFIETNTCWRKKRIQR